MKKILSIILCLTLVLGLAAVASAAEETAGIVTDVSVLADGDRIVIAAYETDVALSSADGSSGNNRGSVAITRNGNTVTTTDANTVFTLVKNSDGTFSFKTADNKFLCRPESGNKNLLTVVDAQATDGSTSFTIDVAVNGVATIKSQGTNTRNWMRFNTGSGGIFACYGSGQNDIAVYKVGYAGGTVGEIEYTNTTVQGAQDAADGSFVEVKGVVTNVYWTAIYIQDETGAIKVTFGENAGCKIGDTVVVKGATSSGEIVSATYTDSEGMTLTAKEVTCADLASLDAGTYVKLTGLVVTEVTLDDNTGALKKVVATDGTNTLSSNGTLASTDDIAVGNVIDVIGTVTTTKDSLWNMSYTVTATSAPQPSNPSEPTTPSAPSNPSEPTTPSEPEKATIADGTYVIYNPAHGMSLSADYAGTYYNQGVAVTAKDGVLTGFGTTEIWTVTNNDDGTITISCADGKLSQSTYSSMGMNLENDTWVLESAGDTKYYVKNVGTGKYIEWYAEMNNWSTYYINDDTDTSLFALQFCAVNADNTSAVIPVPGPAQTGDTIAVFAALLAVSAIGIAVVGSKKKEF